MSGMVFPSSEETARMFGFVTDEDRARWATGREKRKMQKQQQKAEGKAPGLGANAINPALNMAQRSVDAQLRGARTAESIDTRERDQVEEVTTTRRIKRRNAYDLREEEAAKANGEGYEPDV